MIGNINDFRAALKYGGARTSRFQVLLTNPVNTSGDNVFPFMCRAASLPASNITPIEVFHFGRPIKVPGNRTFDDWTVTIINDEDFKIRNAMEEWVNAINTPEGNIRGIGNSETNLIKSTAEVSQLSQTNGILRTYKFVGLMPTAVAAIDLDGGSENVEEFQVTFSVDYFYVSDNVTGNAGGLR